MALPLNPRSDDFAHHGHPAGPGRGLHDGINDIDVFAQNVTAKFNEWIGHDCLCPQLLASAGHRS
jgi:hypothetical protein